MERTEKISIGHYVFSMDEKAYRAIKTYIDTLESHYLKMDDGTEIMDSVEARMAELLYERCGSGGVATETDVKAIIDILGYPEEETGNDTGNQSEAHGASSGQNESPAGAGTQKRLYRDTDNKIIGGVCSGLAQWIGIDPIWLRLIFCIASILLCFGIIGDTDQWCMIPLLIYVILAICIPKATTARQRWEMRGENGSIDDINRYRYEQAHDRNSYNQPQKQGRGCLAVGFGIIILLSGLFGLATKAIVIGSFVLAQSVTAGVAGWMPFGDIYSSMMSVLPVVRLFFNPWMLTLWTLVCIIPSILLIYCGIILIFDISTPKWRPGLCLLILWLILSIGIIPASYYSSIKAMDKIEKLDPDSLPFTVSGNIIKDFVELGEWLDEHDFDDEDWPELQNWLDKQNLDDDDIERIQEWLDKHHLDENLPNMSIEVENNELDSGIQKKVSIRFDSKNSSIDERINFAKMLKENGIAINDSVSEFLGLTEDEIKSIE